MPVTDSLIPGGFGNATGMAMDGSVAPSVGNEFVTTNNPMTIVNPPAPPADVGGLATPVSQATPVAVDPISNIPGAGIGGPAAPTTDLVGNTTPGTTFPANTAGTVGPTNLGLVNPATQWGLDPNILSQLQNLFGSGLGQTFYNFINSGAGYNPTVVQAMQNAMAPYESRSRANILESFGIGGNRNSSPAAIGLGDFESSYALGQENILANMYNQATQRYSDMLGGILNTAHLEEANKLSSWDIISGILGLGNSAGGGLLQSILKGLGIGGSKGGSGGGGGGSGSPSGANLTTDAVANFIQKIRDWLGHKGDNTDAFGVPGTSTGSGTFGNTLPGNIIDMAQYFQDILSKMPNFINSGMGVGTNDNMTNALGQSIFDSLGSIPGGMGGSQGSSIDTVLNLINSLGPTIPGGSFNLDTGFGADTAGIAMNDLYNFWFNSGGWGDMGGGGSGSGGGGGSMGDLGAGEYGWFLDAVGGG